ncbi:MAG: D-Ala-D-Ala carboxypeptidase family metallohydrolase [Pseudomonadota bacterium]
MLFKTIREATEALGETWRWPHFSIAELACRCGGRFCGGEYRHDAAFFDGLEALRGDAGRALIINSGHRCRQWNAAIGGAPRSKHKEIAVDVSLVSQDRHALRRAAQTRGFWGLGLARTFLHLDRRAVPATWYYAGSEAVWKT